MCSLFKTKIGVDFMGVFLRFKIKMFLFLKKEVTNKTGRKRHKTKLVK